MNADFRFKRASRATRWADRPLVWALAFMRPPGLFKTVRRVPFLVLCRLMQIQIAAIEKIAR